MKDFAGKRLVEVYSIAGKQEREAAAAELESELMETLTGEGKEFEERANEVSVAFAALTKHTVRQRILTEQVRIDGRGLTDIRQLTAEVEVLPRVHGSAIFERGETQIMGVTTLNMLKLEQQLDSLHPVKSKRYIHHYNFPPYSTGETGRVGSPKRREIGHGALAERALTPVLPSRENSPTRSARSLRLWARTAPRRWVRSALQPCRCSMPVCPCAHLLRVSQWVLSLTRLMAKPVTPR